MATRVLADIANYLATVPLQRKQQQYENELTNRRLALQEDEAARKAEADRLALENAQFKQQQSNEGQQQLRDYYQAAEIQPSINEFKQGKELTKNVAPYSMDYLLAQPEATPLALTDKYKLSQYSGYNTGVKGTLDKLRADEENRIKGEQFSSKLAQKESELDLREKMGADKLELQEKLIDARSAAADASRAAKEGKDIFEKEYKLTNQFNSLSRDYRTSRDAFLKVKNAAELNTAQGDMALIYGFMRIQDPTSTVREGEYATAEQTRSLPENIVAAYNKAVSGKKLTDGQRKGFVHTAAAQFDIIDRNQKTLEEQYRKVALDYGLDPERIIGRAVKTLDQDKKPTEPAAGTTTPTQSAIDKLKQ